MARYREPVSLTTEPGEELKRWGQSRTLPAGDLFRARLILALGMGGRIVVLVNVELLEMMGLAQIL